MATAFFVPTLKKKERDRLWKAAKRTTTHPKLRDRCRAVLWSEEQKTPTEIGQLLGVHRCTVYRWIKDYIRFGFHGLLPEPIPGRPRQIDEDAEVVLQEALSQNPRELGYEFSSWTLATLAEHLHNRLHFRPQPYTVRDAIRRLGYRYKRPKLSLKHKQDKKSVRKAKAERDTLLKKWTLTPTDTPSSSRTNANFTSTPA